MVLHMQETMLLTCSQEALLPGPLVRHGTGTFQSGRAELIGGIGRLLIKTLANHTIATDNF